MNSYSLNEIEAMGKRAGKGAGLHWGYAEEAGKAARWLGQRNLAGPELLAACLTKFDGVPFSELTPSSMDIFWHNNSRNLCPVIIGPLLCDYSHKFSRNSATQFKSISHPLLLAPYLAIVSNIIGQAIKFSWEGVEICITYSNCQIEGEPDALTVPQTDLAICQVTNFQKIETTTYQKGRVVDAKIWEQLNAFSFRTYAPATQASRLSGAGAGVSDND